MVSTVHTVKIKNNPLRPLDAVAESILLWPLLSPFGGSTVIGPPPTPALHQGDLALSACNQPLVPIRKRISLGRGVSGIWAHARATNPE